MQGRLLPARGGPASPLTIREVVKAAQAKAHRDSSVQILRQAMSKMALQAWPSVISKNQIPALAKKYGLPESEVEAGVSASKTHGHYPHGGSIAAKKRFVHENLAADAEDFKRMYKQAEGELGAALRSTVGSVAGPELGLEEADQVADTQVEDHGTSPSQKAEAVQPAPGRNTSWAPVAADQAAIGLHEDQEKLSAALSSLFSGELEGLSELEKQAFLGRVLRAGRGLAGRMAARGGATGRVGQLLQREVRSPLQMARVGPGSAVVKVRSPLAPAAVPKRAPVPAGPYRTPGTVAAAPAAAPKKSLAEKAKGTYEKAKGKVKGLGKPEGKVAVKPKSLTGALLPGALMLGAGYGLMKGVPAVANWASQAASQPMAYNFGHQQFMYGYGPGGQAQF